MPDDVMTPRVDDPLTIERLSQSVWFVQSPISNAVLLRCDRGVIVFDCLARSDWSQSLFAAAADLAGDRRTVVLNSHHHWDHTFGNVNSPVVPFATASTARHLAEFGRDYFVTAAETTQEPLADGATHSDWLPIGLTIQPDEPLLLSESPLVTVQRARTAAHTDGDAYLTVDDDIALVLCGDLYFAGLFPALDESGSVGGWRSAIRALSEGDAGALYVPGHGRPSDVSGLESLDRYFGAVEGHASAAVTQGLPLDEAESSFPMDDYGSWTRGERHAGVYRRAFEAAKSAGTGTGAR